VQDGDLYKHQGSTDVLALELSDMFQDQFATWRNGVMNSDVDGSRHLTCFVQSSCPQFAKKRKSLDSFLHEVEGLAFDTK
jgi:hypothetical protein